MNKVRFPAVSAGTCTVAQDEVLQQWNLARQEASLFAWSYLKNLL